MLRRAYLLLLLCYPACFRQRFGAELEMAFDTGLRAARHRGDLFTFRFLVTSTTDAVVNGIRERRSARGTPHRIERDRVMTTFIADLKFGWRLLRRSPQLALVAIGTLALGIGLSVSFYSVAHNALLRPLPFDDEAHVFMLHEHAPTKGTTQPNIAPANFLDWRERTSSFVAMGALRPYTATVMTPSGEPVRADGRLVLGEAFQALGLDPIAGRLFIAGDEEPGRDVVILSHRFWRQHLAGDRSIVGRTIMVDERPRTVVGVLEPALRVPGGPIGYDEIFVPWQLTAQQRQGRRSHIAEAVARVRTDVSTAQAQADIARVAEALAVEHPEANKGESVLMVPLRTALVGDVRPALLVLLGAVSIVLLIACANVANLLLARATVRRQEMAVRAALGAERLRLVRQLLAESLLLAVLGAAGGVLVAWWGVRGLGVMLPPELAASLDVRLDPVATAAAVATGVLTAVVFGLAPAWFASEFGPSTLREARTTGGGSARARRGLVTLQVAMAVVLLAGAGLLMRSFARLTSVQPGFRTDNVLTLTLEWPKTRYPGPPEWQAYLERFLPELRALPGVTHAAAIGGLPMNENGGSVGLHVEGQPSTGENEHTYVIYRTVTPGYFETLGIPVLEGRDFSTHDRIDGARVAAVNRTLARRYWPGDSAIGKRVAFTRTPRPEDWVTIVAVVGDTHHWSLAEAIDIQMYVPYTQEPDWLAPGQIAIRTSGETDALIGPVRERAHAIDPLVPISDVRMMRDLVGRSMAAPRFNMALLGTFGFAALTLATIGLYGLLTYSVAVRTREIGIRSALGATRASLAVMVLAQGLRLTAAGIVTGLAVAFVASRWLGALLFETHPHDPQTFAGVALLLLVVATAASYIPARRATRVDPLVSLRTD
jgi:putative ABC transport system permease protein